MNVFRKAAIAAGAAVAGGVLALGGVAHASVGPVSYTPAGTDSISGYYAHALNDSVLFTHLTSYIGSDGAHTPEKLPVSTVAGVDGATTTSIGGAAGIALCNQSTGRSVQLGEVNVGGGMDAIVAAVGVLGTANNDDLCQGGLVNPTGSNTGGDHFAVLYTVPDNDTNVLDIGYDKNSAFSNHGHHFSAGTVVFTSTDLGNPGVAHQVSFDIHGWDVTFNEADAGAISDTANSVALAGTPPYPYAGHNYDPNLLAGFSHTTADGNVVGGHEIFGSFYNTSGWTAYPVASAANGETYLGPTQFVNDGFLELVGAPVSNQA